MHKKIAVLPGDGIGPEVVDQALKVLRTVEKRFGHAFEYRFADVGAVAIDKTGDPLPEATLQTCFDADAVLFGAIGHPKYDNDPSAPVRPEQGLLRLRKSLGCTPTSGRSPSTPPWHTCRRSNPTGCKASTW